MATDRKPLLLLGIREQKKVKSSFLEVPMIIIAIDQRDEFYADMYDDFYGDMYG